MSIKKIEEIDWGDEFFEQFYKEGWQCTLDSGKVVPMTIVTKAIDMLEATGEDEFKDYPIIPEMGLLNKNCHPSISQDMAGDEWEGDYSHLGDVDGYCGLNCYILETFLSTDRLNKNLVSKLAIDKACIKTYKCRFTGEIKEYPAFKDMNDCMEFMEALVHEYADAHMTMIGFLLDRTVNLAGSTGWKGVETCEYGIGGSNE